MPLTIGPSAWWLKTQESVKYYAKLCPVGTTLPDASITICKAGGTAWIVAPESTQVSTSWANSAIVGTGNTTGDLPSISCWATLCSRLISCGFNPSDWFVPSCTQLFNFSTNCRIYWTPSGSCVWSSTETSAVSAWTILPSAFGCCLNSSKTASFFGRAFRCVTY